MRRRAGREQRQVEKAAAVERQFPDVARVFDLPITLLSVASSGVAPASTVTCSVTEPACRVSVHAGALIHLQVDIGNGDGLESRRAYGDAVFARRQMGENVVAEASVTDCWFHP